MNDLETIAKEIADADAILIGASNGLSIAEGYNTFTDDEHFKNVFEDFLDKYNITNNFQRAATVNITNNNIT